MTETSPDQTDSTEVTPDDETYVGMFNDYVATQTWITDADKPLVFHARKLARQLDRQTAATGETLAAKDSAYLQAVERLNKRRITPTAPAPSGAKQMEGQTDVFEYLED